MANKLLIDGSQIDQTKVALVSDTGLEDFEFESTNQKNLKGNIYLGKVSRIEPSLQAAFVDIGSDKNGFLAFGEIHPNYFQIPVADKEALLKEEADNQNLHNNFEEQNEKIEESPKDYGETDEGSNEEKIDAITSDDLSAKSANEASEQKDIVIEPDDLPSLEDETKTEIKHNKSYRNNLRRKLFRSYKIQEVIKNSQLILVQVVKEERGNKGAALTSYISLAGKYTVLMPNSTKTKGISRKIASADERQKLKTMINELNLPIDMGLIVRTAGLNKTKVEIKKDVEILKKLWNNIVNDTTKDTTIAPTLIHEEGNLIRRAIRDIYSKEMKNILVEGLDAFKETKKYISQLLPSCSKYVKEYKSSTPIFSKHGVDNELIKMFETTVNLKSGGYLVINPTEALVAIDVNSGSATKERNIEKTALKTNLEAAEEISKQIKIRDLSGLIVIDFIDMYEMRNNRLVEKKIKEAIKLDRARIQVNRISQFGLMEVSRQRLRQSFIEWTCTLSIESCALKVISLINQEVIASKSKDFHIEINSILLEYLNNHHENEIASIKEKYKVDLIFIENLKLSNESIVFVNNKSAKNKKKPTFKKKKTLKKKILKNKIFDKEDKNKTEIQSQKKHVDPDNAKLDRNKTQKLKSIEEVKGIKKTKTSPKKTGWWSQ
ncbi:Rne/Rng family ribonuclease [Pelagibacteraceae bacterium]|nr:Rne/Rng family ribonuclease [Pelagibacteraceae bacterium]